MASYILRRILLMIPTVVGITMVMFFTMALAPGGVSGMLLAAEGNMRPQERESMRRYINKRFGLDKPLIVQYGRWLNSVSPLGFTVDEAGKLGRLMFKAPDLGTSFLRRRPVVDIVAETLPVTLLLNLIAIPIIYSIAVTSGIYAAKHRGRFLDVGLGVLFIGLWSLPSMWVGVMLLGFFANRDFVKAFPVGGLHDTMAGSMRFLPTVASLGPSLTFALVIVMSVLGAVAAVALPVAVIWMIMRLSGHGDVESKGGTRRPIVVALVCLVVFVAAYGLVTNRGLPDGSAAGQRSWLVDMIWHLVLPVVCLTYGGFAFLSKLMRATVLDNLAADFVRTARAKGVSERQILFRHVLRNSIIPLITVAAGILPSLLGGSLIVETIFSINGMGKLMVDAIFQRDRELVMSVTLVVSIISTVSLLLADLCYALADPRVTYE